MLCKKSNHQVNLIAVVIIVLYAVITFNFIYGNGEILEYPDSRSYYEVAASPLFSGKLWAGDRAPLTPLFFKILNRNPFAISISQIIISIIAWSFLAVIILTTTRSLLVGTIGALAILAYSVTDNIIIWNNMLLSESLGLSLLVALIGSWILYLQKKTIMNSFLVVIISLAFAMTRDTNAYMLAMIGCVIIIIEVLRRFIVGKPFKRSFLVIGVFYLAVFILSVSSQNAGKRWVFPFYNVLSKRILPYPERREFFQDRGMPIDDALLNRSGKWALNDEGAYFNDPELQDFRLWAEEKGKRTYVAFLLHHPGYLAIEPFKPIFNMMNMDLSMYKSREFESSFPGKLWGRLVNKKTIPIFVIASLVFGIFLIFLKGRNRNLSIAAMAIGLLAIPQYVISCHGDAMEVERHCLFSIVQWHLAFILFSIVLIDYLVIKYSPSNKELETYKKIQKIKCVL